MPPAGSMTRSGHWFNHCARNAIGSGSSSARSVACLRRLQLGTNGPFPPWRPMRRRLPPRCRIVDLGPRRRRPLHQQTARARLELVQTAHLGGEPFDLFCDPSCVLRGASRICSRPDQRRTSCDHVQRAHRQQRQNTRTRTRPPSQTTSTDCARPTTRYPSARSPPAPGNREDGPSPRSSRAAAPQHRSSNPSPYGSRPAAHRTGRTDGPARTPTRVTASFCRAAWASTTAPFPNTTPR